MWQAAEIHKDRSRVQPGKKIVADGRTEGRLVFCQRITGAGLADRPVNTRPECRGPICRCRKEPSGNSELCRGHDESDVDAGPIPLFRRVLRKNSRQARIYTRQEPAREAARPAFDAAHDL